MPIPPPAAEKGTAYAKSLLASHPTTSPSAKSQITHLSLIPHPEGGYFAETDRSPLLIPNPYLSLPALSNASTPLPTAASTKASDSTHRNASTTIYYLLSPDSPISTFHRNRSRTIFTLHHGRAGYIILDPSKPAGLNISTFIAGPNLEAGEKLQWVIEGNLFKAVFLLPDVDEQGKEKEGSEKGMLLTETVVPGFEYSDHDFMTGEVLRELVGSEGEAEMAWLLNKNLDTKED